MIGRRQKILDFLQAHPNVWFTDKEISEATQIKSPYAVINDLIFQEEKIIETRRNQPAGKYYRKYNVRIICYKSK